ncbi:MAG: pseudouridine synthase, partial [Patescibacteria group bacterium]
MVPKILYEDKNIIVLDKPAGLLVHGIKSHPGDKTLVDWLLKKYPEIKTVGDEPENRAGIVHRLDKETSGVMLVARNQKSFEYLKGLFQNHEIKKTYVALVWGEIKKPSGIIDLQMGLKSGSLKRTTRLKGTKMIKEAQTIY